MGAKAHGRILFWEGASLWILKAPPGVQYPRTEPHSHHVIQVTLDQEVSLSDAAALVGLSPGRTRHLFVQQTGLPFRTYLLWLRLVRAVEIFAGGASLTDAAHGAGFADSAHLSRTFRRMFGVVAASLRVS